METSPQADINWSAFCYVAGEMSAAEIESFEERLAGDQEAREAVARAVEISQAVASLPAAPVRTATGYTSRLARLAWAAIGAAACLALVLVLKLMEPEQGSSTVPAGPSVAEKDDVEPSRVQGSAIEAGQLVALWADSHATEEELELLLATAGSSDADLEHQTSIAGADDESIDEFAIPDWMLAAISEEEMADDMGDEPDSFPEDN